MFYYRIGSIFVLFENCIGDKWTVTIYKVGVRGGWRNIKQKTKKITGVYKPRMLFKDAVKELRGKYA